MMNVNVAKVFVTHAKCVPEGTVLAHDGLLLAQSCVVVIEQQHTEQKDACASAHEGLDTNI